MPQTANKQPKLSIAITATIISLSFPVLASTPSSSDNANIHFNSQQLGFDSPFVIGAGYNDSTGLMLDAQYSRLFSDNTAISLGTELGQRHLRGNVTLGQQFTANDRAKLTLEALRQKQDYIFRSGTVEEWINQHSIGAEYEHNNPGHTLSAFHLGANYTQSNGKNLADETYLTESDAVFEVFNNERRIAGATKKGLKAGTTVTPRQSTQLTLDLHYDEIEYDTQLSGTAQSFKGAGATASWTEQLNDKTSLNLTASSREPYDRYSAGVTHQLSQRIFGQPASLSARTSHQVGKHGLSDDTLTLFRLNLGGSQSVSSQASNALETTTVTPAKSTAVTTNSNLLAWTKQPAVYESRVLSITDQRATDERLVVANKSDLNAANASLNKEGDITLGNTNATAIRQVTENAQAFSFTANQFRLENGQLVIGMAQLNTPADYFVALEQSNGQFTHVSFATFTGSVGLSFLTIKPNQASADQDAADKTSSHDVAGDLSTVTVNENTAVSIGTQKAFTGVHTNFSASGLPSGLSINASTGVITGTTGTVQNVANERFSISVTATAKDGTSRTIAFTLVVVNSDRGDEASGDAGASSAVTCTGLPLTNGEIVFNSLGSDASSCAANTSWNFGDALLFSFKSSTKFNYQRFDTSGSLANNIDFDYGDFLIQFTAHGKTYRLTGNVTRGSGWSDITFNSATLEDISATTGGGSGGRD